MGLVQTPTALDSSQIFLFPMYGGLAKKYDWQTSRFTCSVASCKYLIKFHEA
jgi:hypothetical protein